MLKGMFLKLGYSCNNNCIHCFVPFSDNPFNKDIKQIKKDLLKAKSLGVERISLTGGEPTIRKDIFEIISLCKKLNFDIIQIQTNARMLSYRKFCKKLIKAGVNDFCISIHGHNAKIHDTITQVKGSFSETVKGIKNIMKLAPDLRQEHIIANLVISKFNYRFLPEIIKFFHEIGFNIIEVEYPRIMGNAERNVDKIPTRTEAAKYIRKASKKADELGVNVLFVDDFPICLSEGFYKNNAYIGYFNSQEELAMSDIGEVMDTEEKDKKHLPICKNCILKNICPGDWPEYPQFFDTKEYKPINKSYFEKNIKKFIKH